MGCIIRFFFANGNFLVSKVDKTFGYVRDDDGALRIVLHHSFTPFSGN
ncbi:hypothetical protein Syn8016DRAFT_0547 [Synechococcus sp. WH 8016]|nr:hypothetical protein Syn8016DRAFT_0547 [Synechococcus sp. WH 8016]